MTLARCSKCGKDPADQNILNWVVLEIRSYDTDHLQPKGRSSVILCVDCEHELLTEALNHHWPDLEKFTGYVTVKDGYIKVEEI